MLNVRMYRYVTGVLCFVFALGYSGSMSGQGDEASEIIGYWRMVKGLDGADSALAHVIIDEEWWTEYRIVLEGSLYEGAEAQGWESINRYRLEFDTIEFPLDRETNHRVAYALRGDTLRVDSGILTRMDSLPRHAELIDRLWVGLSEPDAAGVAAEFGFRFHADGRVDDGWGNRIGRYYTVDNYLALLYEGYSNATEKSDDSEYGTLTHFENVVLMELIADPNAPGKAPIVLRLAAAGPIEEGSEPLVITMYAR